MEFFKQNINIDFMKLRRFAALFSFILFTIAIISLSWRGLNLGLDFTGGTQIELRFSQATDPEMVRNKFHTHGIENVIVQTYGASNDLLITIPPQAGQKESKIQHLALKQQLFKVLPDATIKQEEFIGPQVGKELTQKGITAVIAALIATMAYIALRFEYRFAISAAIALIHDPILILGLFSLFQWEFDLNVLAAILAVIGYSLNDTIVVYDRIRENFRKLRKINVVEVVNASINQTLSRTIMTSLATLLVVFALYFFGGKMIEGFALALIIGILVGTYSSIYVAGALAVKLGLKRQDLLPKVRANTDEQV